MNWQTVEIKKHFEKILLARSRAPKEIGLDGGDYDCNLFILLRNFDETADFLNNSTIEEIGCAIECLEELVQKFSIDQAKKILGIFEKKLIEYPNVQDFCDFVYTEELQLAKNIILYRLQIDGSNQ